MSDSGCWQFTVIVAGSVWQWLLAVSDSGCWQRHCWQWLLPVSGSGCWQFTVVVGTVWQWLLILVINSTTLISSELDLDLTYLICLFNFITQCVCAVCVLCVCCVCCVGRQDQILLSQAKYGCIRPNTAISVQIRLYQTKYCSLRPNTAGVSG